MHKEDVRPDVHFGYCLFGFIGLHASAAVEGRVKLTIKRASFTNKPLALCVVRIDEIIMLQNHICK